MTLSDYIWPGTDLCCVLNFSYRCFSCGHIWCQECSTKYKGFYHSLHTKCYTLKLGSYTWEDYYFWKGV